MRNLNLQHVAHTILDFAFFASGLVNEAQESNAESFKIAEKVSDPISRAWEESFGYLAKASVFEARAADRMFSGLSLESMREFGTGAKLKFFLGSLLSGALREFRRDLKAAAVESLKGAECAEETDSYYVQSYNYANLTRIYAELGEIEKAEKYYKKLAKLLDETSGTLPMNAYITCLWSKAVFFSSKGQWKEANQFFEENLELAKKMGPPNALTAGIRQSYCWALLQQGRFADAKKQFEEAKRIMDSLEKRFEHSNIQGYLIAPMRVEMGKEFNMRLDMANVAKNPAVLVKVEGLLPSDFKVTATQPSFNMQNGSIEMEEKRISPFQNEAVTFTVQATKAGAFTLNPQVVYVDDLGETKTCLLKPVRITAQPAQPAFEVVPGRVSTGIANVDRLLLGGIPEEYAVVLAASSCDERETLLNYFLKAGVEEGETTFYITAELGDARALAEKHQANFHIFVCNPRVDMVIQSLPNVFKLKGVENLTEIDIALTKAFRTLNPADAKPKRACIAIVSDALLQHHAVITRKWLSALLPDLKAKGFTTLALIDPSMHPPEETQAILSLFDGEIRIAEKEGTKGLIKTLKIRKLYNQKYIGDELVLTKEKLLQ